MRVTTTTYEMKITAASVFGDKCENYNFRLVHSVRFGSGRFRSVRFVSVSVRFPSRFFFFFFFQTRTPSANLVSTDYEYIIAVMSGYGGTDDNNNILNE